jgi:hypothetical protein
MKQITKNRFTKNLLSLLRDIEFFHLLGCTVGHPCKFDDHGGTLGDPFEEIFMERRNFY